MKKRLSQNIIIAITIFVGLFSFNSRSEHYNNLKNNFTSFDVSDYENDINESIGSPTNDDNNAENTTESSENAIELSDANRKEYYAIIDKTGEFVEEPTEV